MTDKNKETKDDTAGLIQPVVSERYILFCGDFYYAKGGSFDLKGVYVTLNEAKKIGKNFIDDDTWDWWHVYDLIEKSIVAGSVSQAHGADEID